MTEARSTLAREEGIWEVLPVISCPSAVCSPTRTYSWEHMGDAGANASVGRLRHQNKDVMDVLICDMFGCGPNAYPRRSHGKTAPRNNVTKIQFDAANSKENIRTRIQAFGEGVRQKCAAKAHIEEVRETEKARAALGLPQTRGQVVTLAQLKAADVVVIPGMSDQAHLMAGVLRSYGINAIGLGVPGEAALDAGNHRANGKECIPQVITMGEAEVALRKLLEEHPERSPTSHPRNRHDLRTVPLLELRRSHPADVRATKTERHEGRGVRFRE